MTEFLPSRGHGDNSHIFDTLREGQAILSATGELAVGLTCVSQR